MDKIKIAKAISTITQPPIICIPLFLIISYIISFENGVFNLSKFITVELISLVFTSIMPLIIILYWAKKNGGDIDISNRSARFTPLIVGIISYFIGFLIAYLLNIDNFLILLLLCYATNTGVVLLFTLKWKISVHTTALSGPVAALILLLGPIGAILGIIYPILIWSRVLLKKHTLAQAIAGGVQGFFLTVVEMYLFMYLFNMPITGIESLEMSILYILAIVMTPIVLGVLSYLSPKRLLFIIAEIVMLLLFRLTPISVFTVFILVSLTSILISLYAGSDFIGYKVLISQ